MKQTRLALLLLAAAMIGAPQPAAAQRLIASLSNHRVMVTSSFTGADLVLFGVIETPLPRKAGYDIIATIVGPRRDMVTYRKERLLGIWANVDSEAFEKAPSYLAVLANRPLDVITSGETRRKLQIGLDSFQLRPGQPEGPRDSSFRTAFLEINQQRGFYVEEANAVTFLTPTLFSAPIRLPAGVPVGNYEVNVSLFIDGAMVARSPSAFEVYKAGFEQFVTSAVRTHPLLYGVTTASMALTIGWLASVIFRRD